MAGRIVVARDPGRRWEARLAVRVDGERVGRVAAASWLDFEVEPGAHRVRVSQFGYSSKTLVVSMDDGETVALRSRVRYGVNFLNRMAGSLIGGSVVWLFAQGPTATRLALFTVGVAGTIAVYAARLLISLRADPPV